MNWGFSLNMTVITFAALAVTVALASPIKDEIEATRAGKVKLYPRYIQMSDGNVEAQLVDLEAPVDYDLLREVQRNPANNAYWLYTRSNRDVAQILTFNDAHSIQNSNFDANKPTVLIAHGWLSTGISEPNPIIRAAYLNKQDVNIITVDWRRLAMSDYTTATLGVAAVGEGVGQFINWLHQDFGLSYDQVHLIGFSLGAHLVGNAGRATGGRVARIDGLDPAGPLWDNSSSRLSPTDGVYVEVMHTDGGNSEGAYGISLAIGQVDFFPNGGSSQPGCYTNLCSHNRAWEMLAATITYDHLTGYHCDDALQITWNSCRGVSLRMGNNDLHKTGVSGSYRVETARRYPY